MQCHIAWALAKARVDLGRVQAPPGFWVKVVKKLGLPITALQARKAHADIVRNSSRRFQELVELPDMKWAVTTVLSTFQNNPAVFQLLKAGFPGHVHVGAVSPKNAHLERFAFAACHVRGAVPNIPVRELGSNDISTTEQVRTKVGASVVMGTARTAGQRRALDSLVQYLFNDVVHMLGVNGGAGGTCGLFGGAVIADFYGGLLTDVGWQVHSGARFLRMCPHSFQHLTSPDY